MRYLLKLVEFLCGAETRARVFEPLVADWQRQLNDARGWRGAAVLLSGAGAFLVSLGGCVLIEGSWLPTSRAAGGSLLAFLFAMVGAAAILLILAAESGRAVDVGLIQTQFYLLSMLALIMAAAMLPALFILRRDPRSTTRNAIGVLIAGSIVTAAVVEMTTELTLREYFTSFAVSERDYQRNLANDRAGRYQYPWTAVRQLQGPTTIDQRRESYQRYEAWRKEQEAKEPPPTWRQRVRQQQPTLFAVLFGIMGWTLAGLGPPAVRRAWLWWALMLGAMLALNGTLSYAFRNSFRPPFWFALPVLLAATSLLVARSWRAPSGREP